MVEKHSGKWRMCTNYTNLNKACPNNSYPLPIIHQLVDNASNYRLLSFMDAYFGYNQIRMHPYDEAKTTFITNTRYFYYKLNPEKYSFKVQAGKFLGFMLTKRGIEANLEKCYVVIDMRNPKNIKEVQQLVRRISVLLRFLSWSTETALPIFHYLKMCEKFLWTEQSKEAFQKIKTMLAMPLSLQGRLQDKDQRLIYFMSKVLQGPEKHCPCLNHHVKKLRPYFQSNRVVVWTDLPIKQVLRKPDSAGRMVGWIVQLSKFDILFERRDHIKVKALTDFMTKLAPVSQGDSNGKEWFLSFDGASNKKGSGVGVILEGLDVSLCFKFKGSTNQVEYKAPLPEMKLAGELKAQILMAKRHSKSIAK
ncbi:hypothetical protein CR513_55156, partial [Mucuna pruriens]